MESDSEDIIRVSQNNEVELPVQNHMFIMGDLYAVFSMPFALIDVILHKCWRLRDAEGRTERRECGKHATSKIKTVSIMQLKECWSNTKTYLQTYIPTVTYLVAHV